MTKTIPISREVLEKVKAALEINTRKTSFIVRDYKDDTEAKKGVALGKEALTLLTTAMQKETVSLASSDARQGEILNRCETAPPAEITPTPEKAKSAMRSKEEWADILMAEEIKEWKATGIVGQFLGKDWWITRIHRIQADAIAAQPVKAGKSIPTRGEHKTFNPQDAGFSLVPSTEDIAMIETGYHCPPSPPPDAEMPPDDVLEAICNAAIGVQGITITRLMAMLSCPEYKAWLRNRVNEGFNEGCAFEGKLHD